MVNNIRLESLKLVSASFHTHTHTYKHTLYYNNGSDAIKRITIKLIIYLVFSFFATIITAYADFSFCTSVPFDGALNSESFDPG